MNILEETSINYIIIMKKIGVIYFLLAVIILFLSLCTIIKTTVAAQWLTNEIFVTWVNILNISINRIVYCFICDLHQSR